VVPDYFTRRWKSRQVVYRRHGSCYLALFFILLDSRSLTRQLNKDVAGGGDGGSTVDINNEQINLPYHHGVGVLLVFRCNLLLLLRATMILGVDNLNI